MNSSSSKVNLLKVFESIFYYLAVAISIILFLFALNLGLKNFETGRDLEVFCRAGAVISNGQNPYLTSNLGLELSWNYPSIMAYGFYAVCSFFNVEQNYIWIYALFFLAGLLVWLNRKEWLYGFVLCTTGLFNIGWVMITGNISTIEFLLFSISALLFFKNKINASVFLFSMMASLKLIPILYLPVFLFLQSNLKDKIKTTAWMLAGFLSVPLLSLIASPNLFIWYLKQIFGLIPNQHNPLNEFTATVLSPSFSIMAFSFLGLESQLEKFNFIFSLVMYCLGIFLFYRITKKLRKNNDSEILIYSLGIIILTIALPRLKPYSFLPALLCFYLISKQHTHFRKAIYLVLLSIIPTLLHLIYFYIKNSDELFYKVSPIFLANSLQAILTFHQIVFLFIATIVLILKFVKHGKVDNRES